MIENNGKYGQTQGFWVRLMLVIEHRLPMVSDTSPITIQNDLQLLLFMRLWTSRGELALSTVSDFVNKSASRKIELPDIPNRNLKSELSEMKENLGILLRRLE